MDRVERAAPPRRGARADVLPQGRRAAARPGHRPARPHHAPTALSSTFHSFAYALVRRYAPAGLDAAPLRLLSAPEQDVVLRELLADHPRVACAGPSRCARALGTRGFAREVQACSPGPARSGLDAAGLRRAGRASTACPSSMAAGLLHASSTSTSSTAPSAIDYGDLIRRAALEAEAHRDELRARFAHVVRRRVPGHRPGPGRAAAGAGRRRSQPHRRRRPAPVDLRVPRRRGARHPRVPDRVPARPTARRPTWWRCDHPSLRPARAAGRAARRASARHCPAPSPTRRSEAFRRPTPSRRTRRAGRGLHLRHRAGRGRAPRRPAAPRAPRGRHRRGTTWPSLVRSGRSPSRPAPRRWPRPECRSRSRPTTRPWSATRRCGRCCTRCGWSSTSRRRPDPRRTSTPSRPRSC